MLCRLVKIREAGVQIPKGELKYQVTHTGDLKVIDTLENGYNRVVKVAQFTTDGMGYVMELFDVELVWMNDDRFTLKGIEKVASDRGQIEYAQSWWIRIGLEDKVEEPAGRKYNERRSAR